MNTTTALTMDVHQNSTLSTLSSVAASVVTDSVSDFGTELDSPHSTTTARDPLLSVTQSVTHSVTESGTQSVTQTMTQSVTQVVTQAVTQAVSQTVTEVILNSTSLLNETVTKINSDNGSLADSVDSHMGLAGDLAFPSDRLWVSQGIRSPLLSPSELTIVLIVTGVASIVFLIVILLIIFTTKRKHLYHIIPSTNDNSITYDYIYKPLIGSLVLDEEYENTFVGVSIPLLQDNTKV